MLYKFKSKAAGDLIMLEPNGRRVLEIIGKDAGPKGIILPEEMPAAMQTLEAAIAREEAEQKAATEEAKAKGEVRRAFDGAVSLRQRAVPFLDMLRRCRRPARKSSGGCEVHLPCSREVSGGCLPPLTVEGPAPSPSSPEGRTQVRTAWELSRPWPPRP